MSKQQLVSQDENNKIPGDQLRDDKSSDISYTYTELKYRLNRLQSLPLRIREWLCDQETNSIVYMPSYCPCDGLSNILNQPVLGSLEAGSEDHERTTTTAFYSSK